MFSSTSRILDSPFGQVGWRSFGQKSHFVHPVDHVDSFVRDARRFLVPLMICRVVRFT
jgi:hypothetical protein